MKIWLNNELVDYVTLKPIVPPTTSAIQSFLQGLTHNIFRLIHSVRR